MSKSNPDNLAVSIRQRLLNIARGRNEEFQFVLTRFCLERFMYRLGESSQGEHFTLKGAMLFQAWTGQPHRSTLDLDLLADRTDEPAFYAAMFRALLTSAANDDGLVFLLDSIRGEDIREDQRYQGVRIRMTAQLGTARVPLQIDIGFGDIATPEPTPIKYPTLLELPAPVMKAYSKETVIAEKYEAMTSLGIANSRMKDFYDVWTLLNSYEFDGSLLAKAIARTFRRRNTPIPTDPPIALTAGFANDKGKRVQWSAFVKRGRLLTEVSEFERVIESLSEFLWPPMVAIQRGDMFARHWTPRAGWNEESSPVN